LTGVIVTNPVVTSALPREPCKTCRRAVGLGSPCLAATAMGEPTFGPFCSGDCATVGLLEKQGPAAPADRPYEMGSIEPLDQPWSVLCGETPERPARWLASRNDDGFAREFISQAEANTVRDTMARSWPKVSYEVLRLPKRNHPAVAPPTPTMGPIEKPSRSIANDIAFGSDGKPEMSEPPRHMKFGGVMPAYMAFSVETLARALFATDPRVIALAFTRGEAIRADAAVARAWELGADPKNKNEHAWRTEAERRAEDVEKHMAAQKENPR
jgi:hypothetical protein